VEKHETRLVEEAADLSFYRDEVLMATIEKKENEGFQPILFYKIDH
jgi:hypothetical protein